MIVSISVAVALITSACGCAGLTVWRSVAAESEAMTALRAFVDDSYPGYRIVDSTRSGYILQSEEHVDLRLDVRFEKEGRLAVWEGPPRQELSDGWSTAETFFRHAQGMPKDPRTNMNYDVDGFVQAYVPVRPGQDAVVSAVWFAGIDSTYLETYVVLVARRNRQGSYVESIWPDHKATFRRNPRTGKWIGFAFEPVEIPNPN